MSSSRYMRKNVVRGIIKSLVPIDQASLLSWTAGWKIESPVARSVRKAPLVLPFRLEPERIAAICRGKVENIPIVSATIYIMYGQAYVVAMGQHSASTVEACRVLNVAVPYSYEGIYECRPHEYELRAADDMWSLYRDGERVINFASDNLAGALLRLGVKGK